MARPHARKDASYFDARGRRTDDPEGAVSGEVAEYDDHGQVLRRTRFFLDRSELPWLPVGETAFLLWVLAALVLVWVAIAVVLRLT
jgi:hypothetical protein